MRALLVLLAAGCTQGASGDVVGPFTGAVHRYAVDGITLPQSLTDAHELGDDLIGDNTIANQLGQLTAMLFGEHDLNVHTADLIVSGAIASMVEIRADDLRDDREVGVTYLGFESAPAVVAGGRFDGGVFASNRTRTTHVPGRATFRLAVFADADPTDVVVDGLEIDLTPAGDGYDAVVRGGVAGDVMPLVVAGIRQMITADPADHADLILALDANHDGVVSDSEIAQSKLLVALLTPDISLYDHDGNFHPGLPRDGTPALSFGFAVHLRPAS